MVTQQMRENLEMRADRSLLFKTPETREVGLIFHVNKNSITLKEIEKYYVLAFGDGENNKQDILGILDMYAGFGAVKCNNPLTDDNPLSEATYELTSVHRYLIKNCVK